MPGPPSHTKGRSRALLVFVAIVTIAAFATLLASSRMEGALAAALSASGSALLSIGVAFLVTELLMKPFHDNDIADTFRLSYEIRSSGLKSISRQSDLSLKTLLNREAEIGIFGPLSAIQQIFPLILESVAGRSPRIDIHVETSRTVSDGIKFEDSWNTYDMNSSGASLSVTPDLKAPASLYILTKNECIIGVLQPDGDPVNPLYMTFSRAPREDNMEPTIHRLTTIRRGELIPIWESFNGGEK